MNTETKKETSTLPTKAQVEISEKRKKKKSFSLKLYQRNDDLSMPKTQKTFLSMAFQEKSCVRCGKVFIPTRPEYAWGDCCSYTCHLHRDDNKKVPHTKSVEMFTRDGGYVMSFASSMEAAQYVGLTRPHSIRNCCLGKTKTAAGFVWRYKEEPND